MFLGDYPITKPSTFVAICQRTLQRVKSESLLSDSSERQRSSRLSLKERNERQDTIFPSILRLGIYFVIEPLDIGLISSSFRSFFFATISLFVIELCLSAAKLQNSFDSTKDFRRFLRNIFMMTLAFLSHHDQIFIAVGL